jgi:uncharacterized protein (UPF0548 family)
LRAFRIRHDDIPSCAEAGCLLSPVGRSSPLGAPAVIATGHAVGAAGNPDSIKRLIANSADAAPTYSEVGATLHDVRPDGYRYDRYQISLGIGRAVFFRASTGLQTWKAHQVPGVSVIPPNTLVEPGATVVVTLGTPWLALAAPCRIIGVLDEPDRWGFAYGTLPGHPEQGEESFVVSIGLGDAVTFTVVAFSRPGDRIVRLTGPVGRAVQKAGTNGYLRALQRFVEQPR